MTQPEQNDDPARPKGKVLRLDKPQAELPLRKGGQMRRRRILWLSFLFCVLLPVALVSLYYTVFATDRYAARTGFSIRGIDTGAGIDGLGAFTGLVSTGSTTSDSYIVLDYLRGRTLVEAVDARLDIKRAFSDTHIDAISRLPTNATAEEFVTHWGKRTKTQFDPTSGIIEFEVQSYSAEHAHHIAEAVLELTQSLVNDLSAKARQDALWFARQEVELQETRLRNAMLEIRDFRATEQSVDPTASAALDIELLANLDARLIDLNARIAAQRQTLDENAPSLVALQRSADALSAQIAERRATIGDQFLESSNTSTISERLARYESLEVERALAEQAYTSALTSLEQARRDADRQQRYLAVHLHPQTAQQALYPKAFRNILLIAFALTATWGIATLVTYSVRDHLT